MEAAAPSNSVSAITVGSSGSTHSEPEDAGSWVSAATFLFLKHISEQQKLDNMLSNKVKYTEVKNTKRRRNKIKWIRELLTQ